MKTVFDSSEVAHVWARQSQSEGRTSGNNMYFEGAKIFSYGSHFCMGNLIGNGVVLLTSRTYSNTTHKHQSKVRGAVSHLERIYVPYPEGKLHDQFKRWTDSFISRINVLQSTRTREATKDIQRGALASMVATIDRYCEVTNQSLKKKTVNEDDRKTFLIYYETAKDLQALPALQKKLERKAKAKERAEIKRNKEVIERALVELNLWAKNKPNTWSSFRYSTNTNVIPLMLRVTKVDPETVETSQGARVEYRRAKILYDMIQAGKDIKGFDISGYTVIGINGVLTIGCHKIERKVIARFAKSQKW
jgi:hypothetical protein